MTRVAREVMRAVTPNDGGPARAEACDRSRRGLASSVKTQVCKFVFNASIGGVYDSLLSTEEYLCLEGEQPRPPAGRRGDARRGVASVSVLGFR
jgi:hypothetical protein